MAEDAASNSEKLERMLTLFKMAEEFDSRIALHRGELNIDGEGQNSLLVQVNQIYLGGGAGMVCQ
ncbi:MAG: DUF3450 domain-containing protein [Cellvibrionaceae bacterium]|nr:DUF3450 domain-containing protein [Cellvibrionaceae bacterium]